MTPQDPNPGREIPRIRRVAGVAGSAALRVGGAAGAGSSSGVTRLINAARLRIERQSRAGRVRPGCSRE